MGRGSDPRTTSGRRPKLETGTRMRNLRGLGFGGLFGHSHGATEFIFAGLLDQPPGLADHALRLAMARLMKGLKDSCESAHVFRSCPKECSGLAGQSQRCREV